ncbi:MAG: hypothetical protein ACJ763_13695 [Bdellovibrionia bacterium]
MRASNLILTCALFCAAIGINHASTASAAESAPKQACLDSNPEAKKLLNRFSWQSNDRRFRPNFCDPKNLGYRVAQAVLNLSYVETLSSASAHPGDNGILSTGPFQYFSSRIRSFVFEPNTGNCANLVDAYVKNVGAHDGIMHICQLLSQEDEPWISSSLIHEARHQDGYPHVTCTHGAYAGLSQLLACDPDYTSSGAYRTQTDYFIQMSKIDRIAPSVRQSARANAIQLLVERFNTLPMGIKNGAVLVTDTSKLLFYDGETATSLYPSLQATSRLIKEKGVLSIYDPVKEIVMMLSDGVNLDSTPQKAVTEIRNIIDFYESQPVDCSLFPNRVTCNFSNKEVTLPIKDFTPIGFWTYDPVNQSNPTVYIASKEKRVYALNEYSKDFGSLPTGTQSASKWDSSSRAIVLTYDGQVQLVPRDPNSSDPAELAPGLNPDERFTRMIAPYYWSKQLQEL